MRIHDIAPKVPKNGKRCYRSAVIFFATIIVMVTIGAFIPLLFGRETVGQLETVTETTPALA